jgi:hypothetical protein
MTAAIIDNRDSGEYGLGMYVAIDHDSCHNCDVFHTQLSASSVLYCLSPVITQGHVHNCKLLLHWQFENVIHLVSALRTCSVDCQQSCVARSHA